MACPITSIIISVSMFMVLSSLQEFMRLIG